MTAHLTARAIAIAVDTGADLRSVSLFEDPDGSGWSLMLAGGVAPVDPANDDTYSLSSATHDHPCIDGGIRRLALGTNRLQITLTRLAATRLGYTDPDLSIGLDIAPEQRATLRDGLAGLFAATSPINRPRRLTLPDATPAVAGRPLLSPPRWLRRRRAIRIEHEIVGRRGAFLDVAIVGHPDAVHSGLEADWLSSQLGVNTAELIGRRFTCRVLPDRYGTTFSDFRLLPPDTDTTD